MSNRYEIDAVAEELIRQGWTRVTNCIFTRDELLIGLSVSSFDVEQDSGRQPTRWQREDCGPCIECGGTGEHPHLKHITYEWATTHPDEFRRFSIKTFGIDSGNAMPHTFTDSGVWMCNARHPARGFCVRGRVLRERWTPEGDPLPRFHKTPRGSSWHIERGGEIVAKGRVARGFDWRSHEHPEWDGYAAYTKSMAAIHRAIERANA